MLIAAVPATFPLFSFYFLQDNTRCHLFVQDPASPNVFDAAIGSTFGSKGNATLHGKAIKPGHIKVKVEIVFDEFHTTPLPVPIPEYDIMLLDDAIGTFVQWPTKLVNNSSQKVNKTYVALFFS